MLKSVITFRLVFLICNRYLMKNNLIALKILFQKTSVSLFSILFGIHYLVVLNILFQMNSLINSKELNQ